MEIDIFIEEGIKDCPEPSWLESIAKQVVITQGIDSRVDLSLAIVGQERMRQLNRNYLGRDEPTDVMAFPMLPEQDREDVALFVTPPDERKQLGDVIICYPQAVIQAEEHQHSVKREIAVLIIHGILHLLGYDHDKPEPEREMRARESEILNSMEGRLK